MEVIDLSKRSIPEILEIANRLESEGDHKTACKVWRYYSSRIISENSKLVNQIHVLVKHIEDLSELVKDYVKYNRSKFISF